MDIARCTLDNHNYDIPSFEALGDRIIERYRRRLVCPECGGPGFYRRESTSGQAACFGARPHRDQCSLAATEPRRSGGLGPGQDERINLGERIEVDFNYGADPNVNPDPDEPNNPQGRGGRYVGRGGARNAVIHRRLSTLLRNLIHSEDFRQSNQLIALPEGQFRVRDFFVEFPDIEDTNIGEYRGYWGMIADAALSRFDPPSLWLNSGGRDDVSIVVGDEQSNEFLERFPFEDIEEFAGAYALIFGELRESQNGKKYLAATQIAKLTLSY
ncbi:hypothetical protein [Pseudomonas sp. NFIX28]|uniref:hypothetical protein n=1 Tax=Pseudomonas sp. NFIX28 TaxID=1566235 RepID=UPI0008982150|nr:hypothetical protein [Pseudomonas sp. NFIX28]SDZ64554.1 hypothetical protein SAMN03159453_05441 [Pseudomonas sp. NFIX28]